MSRDTLLEATRALREATESTPAAPPPTRARVMTSLRARRAWHLALVKTALPIAAVLVGSIAYAAAAGKLPASFRFLGARTNVEERAPSAPALPPSSPAGLAMGAPPSSDVAQTEPPSRPVNTVVRAPSDEGIAAPAPDVIRPKVPVARSSPILRPKAAARPPEPEAARNAAPHATAEPDEMALYTAAHRLHFVERNPGAALEAWNRYLGAAPRGRLSVEAHYNRALCLVRLGRVAEARAALEGFARGAYGNYRRDEARALLEAMAPRSP